MRGAWAREIHRWLLRSSLLQRQNFLMSCNGHGSFSCRTSIAKYPTINNGVPWEMTDFECRLGVLMVAHSSSICELIFGLKII